MGKRRKRRQETMWVATSDLPASPGHPFYRRLNQILRRMASTRSSRAYAAGSTLREWVGQVCHQGDTSD